MITRVFFLMLIGSALFSASAQELDTTHIVFRFKSGKDTFYSPYKRNKEDLKKAGVLIKKQKDDIVSGNYKIYVNGYCGSTGTTEERQKRATLMSNDVKGVLIVRDDMKEQYFITQNTTLPYGKFPNAVVIKIGTAPFYMTTEEVAPKTSNDVATKTVYKTDTLIVYQTIRDTISIASQKKDTVFITLKDTAKITPKNDNSTAGYIAKTDKLKDIFSVRTNLLYWAVGMPNIGVEYKPYPVVGILLNAGWAPWKSDNWQHNWAGWFVAPEVRIYIGKKLRWFAGVEFLAAGYNLKPATTGYQGTLIAGGITGGYKLPINKHLDMDFSLGVGYGQLKYDTYQHINNTSSADDLPSGTTSGTTLPSLPNTTTANQQNFYRNKTVVKNTFLPIQAGISLIWKIF